MTKATTWVLMIAVAASFAIWAVEYFANGNDVVARPYVEQMGEGGSSSTAEDVAVEVQDAVAQDAVADSAELYVPQTEEERREIEEEKCVDAFDELTDKWTEPLETGVTMADVDNFVKLFRQVPKTRQDECAHRALNLIPDENVMLLAGILTDRSMDKDIVEMVFNDILNRDEDVKKPILLQIFKNKSHPCHADAVWILESIGELPESE